MPPVVEEQTLNPWSAREPPNLPPLVCILKTRFLGNSLAVQWLGLHTHCRGPRLHPCQGTKISQAKQWCKKKKRSGILFFTRDLEPVATLEAFTVIP